jgi:hypothetical protein
MICDRCGCYCTSVEIIKCKRLCISCKVKEDPPVFYVTRKWHNALLYNTRTNKYLSKDILWYESCGFKLKRHKIYFKKEESPTFREYLCFHYFGSTVCPLLGFYSWPKDTPICQSRVCEI